MKFKHLYYRSEHVAPIVVGMDEISVQFQEIDGLFLFLHPPPPLWGFKWPHCNKSQNGNEAIAGEGNIKF